MAMEQQAVLRAPSVWQPPTAQEAWSLKRTLGPQAVYAAGGTLLRTWWEGGADPMPAHLIDIRSVPGLSGIVKEAGGVTAIGAGTSLSEVRHSPLLAAAYPALTEAALRIAAPSVRNLGTLGGNTASGIGDALPALLVYEAELQWYDGQEELIPLAAWLKEFEASRREAARLLLQIRLPGQAADEAGTDAEKSCLRHFFFYHKVGRREAFTPSVMTAALAGTITEDGRLSEVRAAAGGGAAVPHRLYAVEAILEGRVIDSALLAEVHEAVLDTFRPRGDVFAGEAYRKRTAANVFAAELWKLASNPERKG